MPKNWRQPITARRAVAWIGDSLCALDDGLRPSRHAWLFGLAILIPFSLGADVCLATTPWLGVVTATISLGFGVLLTVCHVASTREDDGTFTRRALWRRLRALVRSIVADVSELPASAPLQWFALLANAIEVVGWAGLMGIELSVVVGAISAESFQFAAPYLRASLAIAASSAVGACELIRAIARRSVRPFRSRELHELLGMVAGGAPVLSRAAIAQAVTGRPPFAREILAVLLAWRPAASGSGRDHALDLARHLRRRAGSLPVDPSPFPRESRITSAVLVGGSVMVLVRRAAHVDPLRAMRSIHRVRAAWPGRALIVAFVENTATGATKSRSGTPELAEKLIGRLVDRMVDAPRVVALWL